MYGDKYVNKINFILSLSLYLSRVLSALETCLNLAFFLFDYLH